MADIDEHLEVLCCLVSQTEDPDELAALHGELGCAYTERYSTAQSYEDLDRVLEHLSAALDGAPQHEDATLWQYLLGAAHAERGEFEFALSRLRNALIGVPHAHVAVGAIAVAIAEVHWDRFALQQHAPGGAVSAGWSLVASISEIYVDRPDYPWYQMLQVLLGGAHHQLYRAAAAGGIELPNELHSALACLRHAYDLPPGDEGGDHREPAAFDLAIVADRLHDLDQGPETWREAVRASGFAAQVVTSDDDQRKLMLELGAWQRTTMWESSRSQADLDTAIAFIWQNLIATAPGDLFWVESYGSLLVEHAGLTGSRPEVDAAIDWLTNAINDAADPIPWTLWMTLGLAAFQRWQHFTTAEDLRRMAGCATSALVGDSGDGARPIWIHSQRLMASFLWRTNVTRVSQEALLAQCEHERLWLDQARAALAEDPLAPLEDRAQLAGVIAACWISVTGTDRGHLDVDEARSLLDLARQLPDPTTEWDHLLGVVDGITSYAVDMMSPQPSGQGFGTDALTSIMQRPDLDEASRRSMDGLLAMMMQARGSRSGDHSMVKAGRTLAHHVLKESDDLSDDDRFVLEAYTQINMLGSHDYHQAADLERLMRVLRAIPDEPHQHHFPMLADLLESMLTGETVESVPAADRQPGLFGDIAAAVGLLKDLMMWSIAVPTKDAGLLRAKAEACRAELASLDLQGTLRGAMSLLLGMLYSKIGALTKERADLDEAVRWCEESNGLLADEGSPFWATVGLEHPRCLRQRRDEGLGDLRRSRELGLAVLRAVNWQVLLQPDTTASLHLARRAASAAGEVANWCLEDQAGPELVRALDAGRGLLLHSVNTSWQMAARLDGAGQGALAQRWRKTGGLGEAASISLAETMFVPDDLRVRVLRQVSRLAEDSLIDPPSVAEIQAALKKLGWDALVYLSPGPDTAAGVATVVPSHGEVHMETLRRLAYGEDSPVHRYLRSHDAVAGDRFRAELNSICRWAWPAATGWLLEHCSRWRLGRPPRLVLVPSGPLGMIPWHAAYREEGPRTRYAVQEAVFSTIASARLLCEIADRAPASASGALIVGDPTADLVHAGLEARAIHQAFYPDQMFMGVDSGVAGTREEVLNWLEGGRDHPRSLLHFACHATVIPSRPTQSCLRLAGRNPLTVADLFEASRSHRIRVSTVVLAACTTNVPGDDYDEAISLATAFLASGVDTVIGSLWKVPDQATSLLMFMFHHFLTGQRCAPADALNRAQNWMLDPARVAPASLPAALLKLGRRDPAEVAAWAGFIHLGR